MTERDLTRSLIYLNLYDMDGLIDIARADTSTNTITPLQFELIQRLATAIVQPIKPATDELFEGQVALAVYPLEPLTPQPPAQQTGRASGVKISNTWRNFYPRGGAPDGRQGHTFKDENQHHDLAGGADNENH